MGEEQDSENDEERFKTLKTHFIKTKATLFTVMVRRKTILDIDAFESAIRNIEDCRTKRVAPLPQALNKEDTQTLLTAHIENRVPPSPKRRF